MNKIAICLNCYYKSNISKLILQLSSLLMTNNNINHVLKIIHSAKNFKNIDECIKYLKNNGFVETKNKNIHIALYCDGLSGQVYKDINDFKNRIDEKEFNEIFGGKIFNKKLKSLPYFIYILDMNKFPEINEKIDEFIKEVNVNNNVNNINSNINNNINNINSNNINTNNNNINNSNINNSNINNTNNNIIYDNINFKGPNMITFQYVYKRYFKDYDYSEKIHELLLLHYPKGFKLTYPVFIELYQLQPELFNDEIEKYFKNFQNYYSHEIKNIFDEFHMKYPNSSLQGTKYHTNVMINRTRFLNDFDEYYKFFIDDDDFTGGLDNYYSIYKWYIKNIDILKSDICKYYKINSRKNIRELIENNINKTFGRELYLNFMKYCIYKFTVYSNEKITSNVSGIWNDIIPPYLPLNFFNVQEMCCDDSSFNALHFTSNFMNTNITYYYDFPSLSDYNRNKSLITEMKIKSIYNYLHKNNLSYLGLNHGRWFYKLNNEIEFIDSKGDEKIIKICNYNDLNEIIINN